MYVWNKEIRMKVKPLLAALAAVLWVQAPAHAAGSPGGYAGLSVGQAGVDDFCDGDWESCDDDALTARIYGGVEFNGYTSVEFGYRYMDDVEFSGTFLGVGVSGSGNAHFVDSTLQLGIPESGPFRIFAKAGLLLWYVDYEVSASNGWISASVDDSDTGVALRTGLGMSYAFTDSFRLRADWDLLVDVGDEDEFGEADINLLSIGPEFRF